jgi:hypothetical protein
VAAFAGVLALGVLVGVTVTHGTTRRSAAGPAGTAGTTAGSTDTTGVPTEPLGAPATLAGSPPQSSPAASPSRTPTRAPSPRVTGRANPSGADLALRRTAFASSIQGVAWPASAAVDGDLESRWSSAFSDPQWMTVDLAAVWSLSDVRVFWEQAYAVKYRVDVSLDNRSWTTVFRTSAGAGSTVDIPLDHVPARYVRVYGTKRSGQYGYSILELEVR